MRVGRDTQSDGDELSVFLAVTSQSPISANFILL